MSSSPITILPTQLADAFDRTDQLASLTGLGANTLVLVGAGISLSPPANLFCFRQQSDDKVQEGDVSFQR